MTLEITDRLPWLEQVSSTGRGAIGHAWEQLVLPIKARGRLLWSPSTTGPVLYPRQIATIHDVGCIDVPQLYPPAFQRAYRTILPLLAKNAIHIVTVSEFSRQRLIALFGLPPDKVSVIFNGVSSAFVPQNPAVISATKARYGIQGRYVLVQASTNPRKNLLGVIEAWRGLGPLRPTDVELVVFGQKTCMGRAGLDLSSESTGGARLLDELPDSDMAALMAGADCFLFASLYEGFGLPVIEAMSTGAAVLTSDSSALPEIANGAALLVDARSPEAIGRGLVTILSSQDLQISLRLRGLERAAAFDWDDSARRYGALFARLA